MEMRCHFNACDKKSFKWTWNFIWYSIPQNLTCALVMRQIIGLYNCLSIELVVPMYDVR